MNVIELEGLRKIQTERQPLPIVSDMLKNNRRGRAVSPERDGGAVWSPHERDDNDLVVGKT